jgi:Ca-activated chloride channel family protein
MRSRPVLIPLAASLVLALSTGCTGDDSDGAVSEYRGDASSGGGEAAPLPPTDGGDPNTFTDAGTNPWTDPAEDDQSTFGLDVDTGSWTIGRRFIADGELPPPEAVRTEEWINALSDVDDTPEDTLGVTVEGGRVDDRLLVRLGVAAREVPADERPDVNLVFVVDTSGSMDEESKIGLVRESLSVLVENLEDDDTVSIVTFDDEAEPTLAPTPVGEGGEILDAIESLDAGGSTNLEGGLRLGYATAEDLVTDEEALTRVVLLSDGVANVGETGPDSLVELIRDDADRGVKLVTVGFGLGGFNDALMEQVADDGDGFYAYVDTIDEAERLFGDELTTTLVTVAEDARAQVTFDPDAVARYRLIGYENRDIADDEFDDDDTDAGELGSGHRVVALYEVEPAAGVDGDTALGSVELRWDDPGADEERTVTTPIEVPVDGDAPEATQVVGAVADLAAELRGAEPSPTVLEEIAVRLDGLAADVDDPVVEEMAELAAEAAQLA